VFQEVPDDEIIIKSMNLDFMAMNTEDTVIETTRPSWWVMSYLKGIVPEETNANKDSKASILFRKGLTHAMKKARSCNYANDDCYTVRIHP